MTPLFLVALVASESEPDNPREVRSNGSDGQGLSCPCPGWTRQTHTATCRQHRGQGCSCRRLPATTVRDTRTCKHVREVQGRIDTNGGWHIVYPMLGNGITLSDSAALAAQARSTQGTCQHCGAAREHWRGSGRPVVPAATGMEWLGGRRAIILRD